MSTTIAASVPRREPVNARGSFDAWADVGVTVALREVAFGLAPPTTLAAIHARGLRCALHRDHRLLRDDATTRGCTELVDRAADGSAGLLMPSASP